MKKETTIQEVLKIQSNYVSYRQNLLTESSFWEANFVDESAWQEHIPFAFWISDILRPKTFVELGTHHGVSYFSFCQAIQELNLGTKAYAIDHWKGDAQSGFYGEEVFKKVTERNSIYSSFSSLIRNNFDDTLAYFEDDSIDLLHIDGCHIYEKAKHDYESWFPKLTANAVVLFHDTNIKERNFGVYRLWSELMNTYNGFEFFHGCGLGILAIGNDYPEALQYLLKNNTGEEGVFIRNFFSRLGSHFKYQFEKTVSHNQIRSLQTAAAEKSNKFDLLNDKLNHEIQQAAEISKRYNDLLVQIEDLKQAFNQSTKDKIAVLEELKSTQNKFSDYEITKRELIYKEEQLSEKNQQFQLLINQEIPRLQSELTTLRETKENLRLEMHKLTIENKELRINHEKKISDISKQAAEAEKNYLVRNRILEKEAGWLKDQLKENSHNSKLLQDQIKKLEQHIVNVDEELAHQSDYVQHFEQALANLLSYLSKEQEYSLLKEPMKDLPGTGIIAIREIQTAFNELISSNRSIKQEFQSLKDKNEESEKQIRSLETTNKQLLIEKSKLENSLVEIQSGVSWRITAPLRAIREKLPSLTRILGSPIRKKVNVDSAQKNIEDPRNKSISEQAELISKSGIFNAEWYIEQYPDIVNFKDGPLNHFLLHGAFENRNPHPLFYTKWYRLYYKLDKPINPLLHFIENASYLNYNPNPFLNLEWYNQIYLKKGLMKSYEVLQDYYQGGEKKHLQPSNNFNPSYYVQHYPEAVDYKYGLLAHYLHTGRIKKCIPFDTSNIRLNSLSKELHQINIDNIKLNETLSQLFGSEKEVKSFFEYCKCLPEDVPLRFNPDAYINYNMDLVNLKGNTYEIFRHFCAHGINENRIYLDLDISETTQRFYQVWNLNPRTILDFRPKVKVCVLVHIYYADLYDELRSYLQNLSVANYHIYFNLVENNWTLDFHRKIKDDFPNARIVISKNIGRDIGGFFNLLSYIGNICEYDSFLLIHSKKSPHISEGMSTKWRRDLLNAIIGSKEITLQNLYLIEKNINIGIIGSELWRHKSIDGNQDKYHKLLDILEIDKANRHCDYLSGTMLWLNSKILEYLYRKCSCLVFEDGNNKTIEFHKDGQWAHAVERALGNICQQMSLKMILR